MPTRHLCLIAVAALASITVASGYAQQGSTRAVTTATVATTATTATIRNSPAEILLKTVPYFSQDKQPIVDVVQALGRTYGISILCEKELDAEVFGEFHNMTLQGILEALCENEGYYWDLEDAGYIVIRRFKTVLYQIEYPQLERKGSTSSSINLGQTGYDGGGSSGSSSGGGGGSGSGEEDSASVSLSQTNENQFWTNITTDITSLKSADEKILVNRFAGTILATASRKTHAILSSFIANINGRIGQQVELFGKIVEVQLNDQNKLGINWELAKTSIGDLSFLNWKSNTDINTTLGGASFATDTVSGVISLGKITSLINALSEQGTLNAVTAPRLVTLNNQTAYIKDTEDRPYFQRTSDTTQTINSGSSNVISSATYETNTISIGTIIAITPHVADNGDITLDITPALTRLNRDMMSPDGYSTAPSLYIKQASTIVRLRSGETAVIGGIITDGDYTSKRSVPGVSSLPLIGRLFRSEGVYRSKTEVVIFITPRIILPGNSLTPEATIEAAPRSPNGNRPGAARGGPPPPPPARAPGGAGGGR
ncbi:MAG: secretin N-terminal domain-containing protein, partial [Opitutaceae bacterium]|nr:secretin N-terminal domain-containing protein [Opitutaceae bacterium]